MSMSIFGEGGIVVAIVPFLASSGLGRLDGLVCFSKDVVVQDLWVANKMFNQG